MVDRRDLPLNPAIRPGSVIRPKRRSKDWEVFRVFVVAGVFVIVCVALIAALVRSPAPGYRRADPVVPGNVAGRSTAEAWRAALADGDGHDWLRLSDRDKMALCLSAARALGKGEREAWAYRQFLEEFYRRPNPETRGRPISQTIAVCQACIDNGTISLD